MAADMTDASWNGINTETQTEADHPSNQILCLVASLHEMASMHGIALYSKFEKVHEFGSIQGLDWTFKGSRNHGHNRGKVRWNRQQNLEITGAFSEEVTAFSFKCLRVARRF
jgi:hypothetical protein